jgi:hypothetical protein
MALDTKTDAYDVENVDINDTIQPHPDDDFGGTENRKKIERRLLRKLDLRMSILIVIYILNYVCGHFECHDRHLNIPS